MSEPQEPEERLGSYRVVRRLATGGTSDLLLARSEGPLGFERQVVLKVLGDRFREDSAVARMFVTEAAAYARLSHPAIVRLFDFFSHEDRLVMVLELVDGLTLRRLKASADGLGHALSDRVCMYVARRIFEALACAHAAVDQDGKATPIIHRDVNPSNVLVSWTGDVKIVDFGVARVTGLHAETQGGAPKGTLGYMAPEQVRGATIAPATDVYGAGVVLWELLANRRAFTRGKGTDIDLLKAMATPAIPSLDELRLDLDKALRDLVRAALEIDREKRTTTAEEAARILGSLDEPEAGKAELVTLLQAIKEKREGDRKSAPASAPAPKPPLPVPAVDAHSAPPVVSDKPRPPMKRRMSGLGPGIQAVGGKMAPPSDVPSAPILDEAIDPALVPQPEKSAPRVAAPLVPAAREPAVPVGPVGPVVRARPPPATPPLEIPPESALEIADNGLYVPASMPEAEPEPESLELLKARAAARAAARRRAPAPGIASWKIGVGIAVGLPLVALGAYLALRDPDDSPRPTPAPAPSAPSLSSSLPSWPDATPSPSGK